MNNYIKIKNFSPLFSEYAYIDHFDSYDNDDEEVTVYDIDLLLIENNFPLIFEGEFLHEDHPGFCISLAKCFRWNNKKFTTIIMPSLDKKLEKKYGEAYLDVREKVNYIIENKEEILRDEDTSR